MKTNTKVLIGVFVLAGIGAAVYFSKSELQKGATRRPVQRPDYEIQSITVDPATPVEGENFKISVVVKNKSATSAATVPSQTLLHLSGQPLPIATTQPLGPLATEEAVWQTTSTQRRLLIRSCADANRAIAESEERNNCKETTLDLLPPPIQEQPPLPACTDDQYTCESWTECRAAGSQTGTSCMVNNQGACVIPLGPLTRACTPPPPPMPDLVIEDVTLTQNQSGWIIAAIRIRNIGTAAAHFSDSSVLKIRHSAVSNGGSAYSLETQLLSNGTSGSTAFSIGAGSTLGNIFLFIYPNNWHNATDLSFTIDSGYSVVESNETNNTYDIAIPAEFLAWEAPPDLRIILIERDSGYPIAGNPANFYVNVWNAGSTTAPASTTTFTINSTYNGTSTAASIGEVYRQDVATPELWSGQMARADLNWPSAIEGNFWVNACADSGSVVTEDFNRWNNCAVRNFTVAPAPSE